MTCRGLVCAVSGALLAAGCGGESTHRHVGASPDAGGACPERASAVPDAGTFVPPPVDALGSYALTFRNRCTQTVWPAWGSSGGLDDSVIDPALWFPMAPASDRTVIVYGGVREVGFWGRTGCSFDQTGSGTCATGDCGGFICPIRINQFPMSTTIFTLEGGFLGGYNLDLSVDGPACGSHACVADVHACEDDSVVTDPCGALIACRDICVPTGNCCLGVSAGCAANPPSGDATGAGDLVLTFCP